MLTRVILEGQMGERFGREWSLHISSPAEALRMVDANKPGVFNWIRANLSKYSHYRVVCEYENGRVEELDQDTYVMRGQPTTIRFVPLIAGSSGVVKAIVGIVLVVVGVILEQPWMIKLGVSMTISGVIEALTPRPHKQQDEGKTNSYFFDGPVNTDTQGSPVPLIYGRILAGSQVVSAAVTIDQLM